MKKILLIIVPVLFLFYVLSHSETLTGTVTDITNSNPISGATVTVVELSTSVTTNSLGLYAFGDLAGGTHTVRASASGYVVQQKTVYLTQTSTTTLDHK